MFITGNTGKVISQSILSPFHFCMARLSGVEAHGADFWIEVYVFLSFNRAPFLVPPAFVFKGP